MPKPQKQVALLKKDDHVLLELPELGKPKASAISPLYDKFTFLEEPCYFSELMFSVKCPFKNLFSYFGVTISAKVLPLCLHEEYPLPVKTVCAFGA